MNVATPSQTVYTYEILPNPQQLVINLPQITLTPSNCPADLFIGVTDTNGQPVSFITVSQNPVPKLIVQTSDTSLQGDQVIHVII